MSKIEQVEIPVKVYDCNNLPKDKIYEGHQYKIIKLSDDVFDGDHPNGVYAGFTVTGVFEQKPTVGESFRICSTKYYNESLTTSEVIEIIDEFTFKTMNSTYKLIKVDEDN